MSDDSATRQEDVYGLRGLIEPKPPRRGDITNLAQLGKWTGYVVKYTINQGRTWHYVLLEPRGPMHFSEPPSYGYSAVREVSINGVDSITALTQESFAAGMVARPAKPSEYRGVTFSYGEEPPSSFGIATALVLLSSIKLPRKHKKAVQKRWLDLGRCEEKRARRAYAHLLKI